MKQFTDEQMVGIVITISLILDASIATEKRPRMRDKVGCRDEFDCNLQNL